MTGWSAFRIGLIYGTVSTTGISTSHDLLYLHWKADVGVCELATEFHVSSTVMRYFSLKFL